MVDSEEKIELSKTPRKKSGKPIFKIIRGIVKVLAILVGLPLSILSLMSLIGLVTDNFWIRLIPSIILVIGVPLFLVDRLLPDDDQDKARGLPTDVIALSWLGLGVLYIGVAHSITGDWLIAEADRFTSSGSTTIANTTYWMAGATPVSPGESQTTDGDAGVDGSADSGSSEATSDGSPSSGSDGGTNSESGDGGTSEDQTDQTDGGPSKTPEDGENRKAYSPSELFRKASPAVVTISVSGRHGNKGSGTGFFIDYDGTIATNQHVIKGAEGIGIKLKSSQWLNRVELLIEDEEHDLALLRVPPQEGIEPLRLGDSDNVTVGEQLICIGNPLGLEHTLSDGIVSSRRRHKNKNWVQMTVPISPGNSGGPVINLYGEVVGIATASMGRVFGGAQNLNLAVPVNALKSLILEDYPDRRQLDTGPHGSSTW